jgi:hypothetical protein
VETRKNKPFLQTTGERAARNKAAFARRDPPFAWAALDFKGL